LNGTGSDRIGRYGDRFGVVIQLYYVGKIQVRIIETREQVYRYRSRHDDILKDEADDTMTGKDDSVDTLGDKMSDLLWFWIR
jgi:hypothetical protein